MSWLRSSIVSLVVLILIVCFAVPYGMGYVIQSNYAKWLEKIASNNPGLQVSMQDYRRSFFHSTGQLKVTVTDPAMMNLFGVTQDDSSFNVDLDIHHGLFVFAKKPNSGMSLHFAEAVVDASINNKAMQLESLSSISLLQNVKTSIYISKWNIVSGHGVGVVKDVVAESSFALDKSRGVSSWNIGSVTIHDSGPFIASITLHDAAINSNFRKEGSIVSGKRVVNIKTMLLESHSGSHLIDNLEIGSAVQPKDSTTSIGLYASFSKATSDKVSTGPFNASLNIDNIVSSSLGDLQDKINDTQQSVAGNNVIGAAQSIDTKALLFPALKVLKGGLNGSLNVDYSSNSGPVKLTGKLTIPATKNELEIITTSAVDANLDAPSLWLESMRAQIDHALSLLGNGPEVSMDVAQQKSKKIVQGLIDNKMLIQSQDSLHLTFKYAKGVSTVNGLAPNFTVSNADTNSDSDSDSDADAIAASNGAADSSVVETQSHDN